MMYVCYRCGNLCAENDVVLENTVEVFDLYFHVKCWKEHHGNSTIMATIQISNELKDTLEKCKMSSQDSYEDVIWDLYEDTAELSEETKRNIKKSRKEIAKGKVFTLEQVKKKLGMKSKQ